MSVEKVVQLKACDKDDVIKVTLEVANMSASIKNMIDDLGTDNLSDHQIPLANVDYLTLLKVVEYCEHYAGKTEEQTPEKETRNNVICEWDQEFFKVEQKELFAIIMAANFLDIKPLLDGGCKSVANMIRGKSVSEIRETFNIQNDFSAEEEEAIRKENAWITEQ